MTSGYPDYTGDDERTCVKCGHLTIPDTRYQADVTDGYGTPLVEYLRRQCGHCHYEWREAVVGA